MDVPATMAIAAAAVLILIMPAAVSHLIWKRSFRATAVEFMIRHHKRPNGLYKDSAGVADVMERRRARGERPYVMPEGLKIPCEIAESSSHGMQVFTMNPSSGSGITVFFTPGGSFTYHIRTYHWKMLSKIIAQTDAKIVVVQYPLLPFHDCGDTYPAIVDIFNETVPADGGRAILMGDSAGGNVALRIEERLALSGSRQPDEMILISPASGIKGTYEPGFLEGVAAKCPFISVEAAWVVGGLWAGKDRTTDDPDVAPLLGVVPGMCRTHIFSGTRDIFHYESMELCEEMRLKGNDCEFYVGEGLNHVYPLMPIPEARSVLKRMSRIIRGD